jgi:hypothetical protein
MELDSYRIGKGPRHSHPASQERKCSMSTRDDNQSPFDWTPTVAPDDASPVQGAASDADRLQALRDESDRRHIEAKHSLRGAASSEACPLGCTGPESGGSGCMAVVGECAASSASGEDGFRFKPAGHLNDERRATIGRAAAVFDSLGRTAIANEIRANLSGEAKGAAVGTQEGLEESLACALAEHTNLSTDGIDEWVPRLIAALPVAALPFTIVPTEGIDPALYTSAPLGALQTALDAFKAYPGGWANDVQKCLWEGIKSEAVEALKAAIANPGAAVAKADQASGSDQAHVMPPMRGTDGQHDAECAPLDEECIRTLWQKSFLAALDDAGFGVGNGDVAHMNHPIFFTRAIEAELASRSRKGRDTCNDSANSCAHPAPKGGDK